MEAIKFTRQELYELVWKEPIISIAKRLNVSDYEVRKTCIAMKIPLPIAGYWQKIKSNKKVAIKELDKSYVGIDEISLNIKQVDGLKKETSLDSHINEVKKENDLYKVSKELANPDKLILSAKKSIEDKLKQRFPRNGVVRSGYDQIEINVSKENVDRALRIMMLWLKAYAIEAINLKLKIGIATQF